MSLFLNVPLFRGSSESLRDLPPVTNAAAPSALERQTHISDAGWVLSEGPAPFNCCEDSGGRAPKGFYQPNQPFGRVIKPPETLKEAETTVLLVLVEFQSSALDVSHLIVSFTAASGAKRIRTGISN